MFARTPLIAAAMLIATGIAAPVLAQGPETIVEAETGEQIPTQRVGYADLNLRTDDGVTSLKRRVRKAAQSVCGYYSAVTGRDLTNAAQCAWESQQRAKPQIAQAIQKAGSAQVAIVVSR